MTAPPIARRGPVTAARSPDAGGDGALRWRLSPAGAFAVCAVAALWFGWQFPTERYITPERGLGYALGIAGGSLMLLLFLYSARKHFSWLGFLGSVAGWFRLHMVLGILGPLCILYHSNFQLGATNSNVALFCMLTVAGSGLIGRYIYSRIHLGLYGRKTDLGELRQSAERMRSLSGAVSFLPELVARLEACEKQLLNSGSRFALFGLAKPLFVSTRALVSRWRLRRYVRRALRAAARTSPTLAAEQARLRRVAVGYVDRRLHATRKVAELQAYERLFSVWHALHLPLIFMLVAAAIIHIVAVHVY